MFGNPRPSRGPSIVCTLLGLLLWANPNANLALQFDADLTFDELNSLHSDSNALSNAINPLSSPLLHEDKRARKVASRSDFVDDEDFYQDAEDGPSGFEFPVHSGDDRTPTEEPTSPHVPVVDSAEKPVYIRIVLTITNVPYESALSEKTSPQFEKLSEEIILALESLYRTIPGQQAVTVLSFEPQGQTGRPSILVTFDVGSLGNNDHNSIENVIRQAIARGYAGRFSLSPERFSFRIIGAPSVGIPRVCSANQITCTSGECIEVHRRCDGHQDCHDGSDELGCPVTESSNVQRIYGHSGCRSDDQMICKDGTCIDSDRICDGIKDCSLGDDEENCGTTTCPSGQFLCDGQRCIDEAKRCDDRPDCFDRTDENECDDSLKPHLCQPDEFSCTTGECIKYFQRCDFNVDCPNGEDESLCQGCSPDEFLCADKTCIDNIQYCDGKPDCPDNSDETNCTGLVCLPGQFRCENGSCIDISLRCNGREECPDKSGADEKGCPCSSHMWQCDMGECIDRRFRCDGKKDCPLDSSDERDCPTVTPIHECSSGQFRCSDGRCIHIRSRCNGRRECADGSDERNCPCRTDQFMCENGFCISLERKCDGYNDCQDSSDEKNCPGQCEVTEFRCAEGKTCIPASARCDRRYDCPDGSDELDCRNPTTQCRFDQFRCTDGMCLNIAQRCDGNADCSGGEDESGCGICPANQFRCSDGTCINYKFRCNDEFDCRDGSDEKNCETKLQCKITDYVCSDGTCINQTIKCDGKVHCEDGGDEQICRRCGSGEFVCNNGQCIDARQRCDGRSHCPNGEDEADCPVECQSNQFHCSNGQCIDELRYCDGRPDCADSSDELECEARCKPTDIVCRDGSCIDRSKRCDGIADCPEGIDEEKCECQKNEFKCIDGACIDEQRYCDGYPDCRDRSDEVNCEKCAANFFRCSDGTCIDQRRQCDGRRDCFDNSDEEQCECREGQFRCTDGTCINARQKCDRRADCRDYSDEHDCETQTCRPDEFRCRDGHCIEGKLRCDKKYDCSDGTDEFECVPEACQPDEFRCSDGQCIESNMRCDRRYDCRDGSDELSCEPEACQAHDFRCNDGQCIENHLKCDRKYDCRDGSDERDCVPPACSSNQFRCNDGQCIEANLHCDRKYDCRDGSDEINCVPEACNSDQFRCSDGQCIEKRFRCDRKYDCRDGSDERECVPEACHSEQFRCNDGQCIDKNLKCDRKYDCRDGSDESECVPKACQSDQFHCNDGQCIDKSLKCDRKYDCRDGSDETDCAHCKQTDFQCEDGTCVDSHVRCDGRNDCPDRSDERDCGCLPTQFQCISGECLDTRSRCDGLSDCLDGSDENDCKECDTDEYQCSDGKCIDDTFRCDGLYDCADYSDEQDCETRLCRPSQFRCLTGLCIDRVKYCDGLPDCPDRSDDLDCWACPPGQYICANGQCIERSQRCDGTFDCSDYSDESDCAPEGEVNIKVYPERQSIRQGREVVFRCRDEGTRRSPVKWTRADNRALPPGTVDVRGRLTMPNIQPEHSGVYICASLGVSSGTSGAKKAAFLTVQPSVPSYGTYLPHIESTNLEDVPPITTTTRPPGTCSRTEATCQNRECIPWEYVCDGDFDCTDRSDESNCGHQFQCEPNEFQCDNKKCVLKVWRCDGDNDCGDSSDEKSCTPNPPGSPCRYDEYRCLSGDQCIPKSFQCDGEFDCQDKSDEIGCASPTITQPPPETLTVEEGETVAVTCTAVGNPTPLISWRLNWGNIPPPPRVTVSTENGRGTVTIRDARPNDQGAWSCEAINSKDSVLAVPDTILVVKPKAGICRPPLFNEKAEVSSDCLRCFCFGVTETCYSSSLHATSIPLQTEVSIIALQKDPRGNYLDVGQRYPPDQNAVQYNSANREYRVQGQVRNNAPIDVYYYWSLPPEFLGNQLNSYGGNIHYVFRYRAPFIPKLPRIADVIMKGNGITLYHVLKQPYGPQRDNSVEVRFWEGEWHKNEAQGRGDVPVVDITTREDIMMVLQNVEAIYLRASYDEEVIDSSILNFQMATASLTDPSAPQAVYVEKCSCPQGYTGNSCEECAEGYSRRRTGTGLGDCVPSRVPCNCHGHSSLCDPVSGECLNCQHNSEGRQCERCKRGYFGDARRGTPDDCQPCPCPLITTPNQFSPTCILDTDGQVTCDACPIGYEGRRCERCAPGYEGNPNIPGGSCRVRGGLQCDPVGSLTPEPSRTTGLCQCKPYVTGARCDQCKAHTFHLNPGSPLGCIDCFCMGITKACSSCTWHRDEITLQFTSSTQGVTLTNILTTFNVDQNLQVDPRNRELVFRNFATQPVQTYYWKLPPIFLGDKVTAYGGKLNYTVMFIPGSRADPNLDPDVQIMGNGIVLMYRHPELIRPGNQHSVSIPMYETYWIRSDGQPATREHLLMTLADLDAILIKATYTGETTSASLADVSLMIAVDRPTGRQRALAVEQCRCPIGYTGLSCEDCDAGYTRSGAGLYLGLCEPCFCNGHSSDCDPESGICKNCQHNTEGDFCEVCAPGYVGVASGGTPNDCQPAIEPPCRCDSRGSLGLECDYRNTCPCKPNVQGSNCNRCKEGFFNLEARNPEGCAPCFCFGVTQQCSSSSYYRNQIEMRLQDLPDPYSHNFQLTSRFRTRTITEGIIINPSQNEVSFTSFPREPEQTETLFWSLPARFLGNKLASYGGKLHYTQQYTAGDGGDLYADADVEMTGNGISIFFVNIPTLNPQETRTYEIELRETNWQRVDSRGPTSATRDDFMKVLANVEALLIRASFHNRMQQTMLRDVQMDTSVPQSTGQPLAVEVEQCVCPPGYIGLSCEECAPGYIRDTSGPGLGRCTRCNCNGHSESCDATTGRCVRCRHNTVGDNCERCADGFYGDATRGTPEDCKSCPCPLTTSPNQFSPTCFLDTDGQPTCNACPPGYIGRNCEKCSAGYRGTPVQPGGRCEPTGGSELKISVIPSNLIKQIGEQARIECHVTSRHPFRVQWIHNNHTVQPPSFGVQVNNSEEGSIVSIASLADHHKGLYTCRAISKSRSVQKVAKLAVLGPGPTIKVRVEEPRTQRVPVGATVTFRCTGVSQVSDVTYTLVWTKEGASMPTQATEASGVLAIPSVRPEDTGTYICTGSDLTSVAQDRATLLVEGTGRPTPPRVTIEPHYQEVKVGDQVEFRCIAEGFPEPELRWTGGRNNQINPQATFIGGFFRIPSCKKSDEAEYFCTATNSAGSESVRTILLVRGEDAGRGEKPQLTISPSTYEAQRSETVRFECRVTGSPTPSITWSFSGGLLPDDSSQSGGILTLPRVTETHQGVYVCTVSNVHGTAQAQARLLIATRRSPPTARVEPERQTIVQGSSGELRCIISGTPRPTVVWTKVGADLSNRHQIEGDNLLIADVTVEDRGLYVCRAENRDGTAQASAIVEVERREIPSIQLYPEAKQIIIRGGSTLFQCRVISGVPTPSVEWIRADGSPFTSSTEIQNGGVIRFNRVTGDEEGTYVCTAENSAGRVTAKAVLQIQGAPTVGIVQSNPYRVRPGETVRFECNSEGDPRPNIVWRKLRHPLVSYADPEEAEDGTAVLEIRRVSHSDSGVYICSARNSAGVTEERIQLIVEETDSVVPEVMVEDRVTTVPRGHDAELRCFVRGTDREVYLKWIRSDGGQMPTNHRLQDGVLYINNVQPQDAGEYSCLGIVETDTVLFTAKARLAVVAPPKIQLSPPRQTARPGDVIYIQCTASGGQPIAIDWSRIGGNLAPNVIQNGGVLEFRGITVNDAGRYLCTAVNAAGKAEGVAEVIVNEEPVVDIVKKEETAFVGSNVQLKCPVSGSPLPTLDWTKDGGPLPNNSRVINNELWIHDVKLDNAGRYICTASNNAGRTRDYVILNVRVFSSDPVSEDSTSKCNSDKFMCHDGECIDILWRCDNISDCDDGSDELGCNRKQKRAIPTLEVKIEASKEVVNLGDTLDLRCKVTGDPSARIHWAKVAQDGPLPDNVRIRGSILLINGVMPENGGVYRCSVESYAGTFSDDYVLAIQISPVIPPDLVETRTAPFGSTVVMNCQTTLDPPVAYTWYKQGGILPTDATVNGGQLTIPGVRGEDAGTYICAAKSDLATIDIPTILIVTGVVPYFAQAPLSYMKMPTLTDAYMNLEVEIAFKPESMNGLLLYNGQKEGDSGDFVSLSLNDSFVEFRFELGSGPAILRSQSPVEIGKWHIAHISRDKKNGNLKVDDQPEVTGAAQGRFLGLDLIEPMYIGAVPDFNVIPRTAGSLKGFVGCISHYKAGNVVHNLLRDAESYGIATCETCSLNPCLHGGVCQEALTITGYNCICPLGFSGRDCEKVGEACYPGVCGEGRCINRPGGGFDCYCPLGRTGLRCEKDIVIIEPAFSDDAFIAYPTPNALRTLKLNMKLKPRKTDDCLLAYCAQNEDGQGDFTSIAIKNNSVEFRFDTGSGPAIIRSPDKLQADEWISIVAERDMREGSLIVNDGVAAKGMSPGHTRGLNLRLPLYVGGVDKHRVTVSPFAEVQHGFDGCISHIEVNDVKVDLVHSVVDSSNVEDCGGRMPCENNPCLNDGACIENEDAPHGFICECTEGFSGISCEVEEDLCSLIEPCKNGGTCIGTGNSYKCSCPLGFLGTNCEEAVIFDDTASFQGEGYISLDRELLPHTASTIDEVVSFSFSTSALEGLLLFHGQKPESDGKGQDYLAVAIVDGYLEFSYELGSGPAQIKSPVKVNDGKGHIVTIKRTGKHGSLELDNLHQNYGESQGILQMLNTDGNIFIGGVPNHQLMTAGRFPHGLIGCLWDLQIQDSGPINLFTSAKTGANVQPCDEEEASGEHYLEELDEGNFIPK